MIRKLESLLTATLRDEQGESYDDVIRAAIDDARELIAALTALLPLAEAYLRAAPSHPDHAKLATARATIRKARA